ncbi:MAG: hypothetical protein ACR2M1_10170 [Gemmatimonadaceae bacterium]
MAEPTSTVPEPQVQESSQLHDPETPSLEFPLGWLLDNASPPIQYRAAVDVAGLPSDVGMASLPYASQTGIRIALSQSLDGTWSQRMLSLPESPEHGVRGLGTIPAVRRLLEYGWDRESPPLAHARRPLFRLLSEDNDPHYLYDLRGTTTNPESALRGRQILREAAAASLAQAGYEADPRIRGAARRILERIDAYLDSALSDKPWVRIGNRHVLSETASPPSIYALVMLAYMPIFRSEHYPEMERLYAYLAQTKPSQEAVQLYGKEIITQPHLVMGDLLHNRNAVDSDVPFALMWLELMARFGFLKRNENWLKLFERFASDRKRDRVWRPHRGQEMPRSSNPFVWSTFPLEDQHEGDGRWTDVTFRVGLIGRLLGWRIELV